MLDNFERESIRERQERAKIAKSEAEKELRHTLAKLVETSAGIKLFRYLFFLSGGDDPLLRFDMQGQLDRDGTLINQARKDFYNQVRKNLPSHKLMEIERSFWEEQGEN